MIEIVHLPVDALDANSWNPNVQTDRVMQAARESIQTFGMIDPVLVRVKGHRWEIIDGEHRWRVCQERGDETVPAIVVKAGDAEARKLTIILNDIKGRHDPDLLGALLTDLRLELDPDEFALALPYDDDELTRLLDRTIDTPGEEADSVPDVAEGPADSKPGDVYQLGPHTLVCGSATSIAWPAKLLPDAKAALLFTSPPYGDAREYDASSGVDLRPETLAKFIPTWAKHVDVMAVNLGILKRDHEIVPYWDVYTKAAHDAGLKMLAWNVWDRGEAGTMGQQTQMFPLHHEWLFIYGGDAKIIHRTVKNKGVGGRAGATVRQTDGSVRPTTAPEKIQEHGKMGSVFHNPPHKGASAGHPAVFPAALPHAYIEALTNVGDVVVDPFAGSGTTMIAADNLGRVCVMTEISPIYCDVIRRRWEEHTAR